MLDQTSAIPLIDVGDTWHYHYSGPEGDSVESILRTVACGRVQCNVDQEVNPAYNDTVFLTPDWNLTREYYHGYNPIDTSFTVYTPALLLYPFPLQPGKSWWWNSTASGWDKDSTGDNITINAPFSVLRKVVNETTVTVPAGIFDTFLVAQYREGTVLREYRWFSFQAKTSVKLMIFDNTGGVTDTYVMISYSLVQALPNPTPNPTPTPNPNPPPPTTAPMILGLDPKLFYIIAGAVLVVMGAVAATALRGRRIPRNILENRTP